MKTPCERTASHLSTLGVSCFAGRLSFGGGMPVGEASFRNFGPGGTDLLDIYMKVYMYGYYRLGIIKRVSHPRTVDLYILRVPDLSLFYYRTGHTSSKSTR